MTRSAEATIREAFVEQAGACAERGSPFTSRLCEALAHVLDRSTAIGRRVLDWPGRPDARGDSVPLRLAGGLHALVRRGSLPGLAMLYPPHPLPDLGSLESALSEVLPKADDTLLPWLDLPPQTNEPMRSAPLMGGLLAAADTGRPPLAPYEPAPSAGPLPVPHPYQHPPGSPPAGTPRPPVTIHPAWHRRPPPRA